MSKVFVIPDVHLKPWMFKKADGLVSEDKYDYIVILGDLVDDWGQGRNLNLYSETFDAAIGFIVKHPNTLFCYGNHDLSYIWEAFESGYSAYARPLVVERMKELKSKLPNENIGYIHRIDNVLFSHGGLTESFVRLHFGSMQNYDLDHMIRYINTMGPRFMWTNDSPIWARPQFGNMRLYPPDMMQVVGHTPVETPFREGNLLSLDNFSEYESGCPIGHKTFCWVDTVKMEYSTIE